MPQWLSWIGHGTAGFLGAFLLGVEGYTLVVGFYAGKEYVESKHLRSISRDNVLDFVSPVAGGGLGFIVRYLVGV